MPNFTQKLEVDYYLAMPLDADKRCILQYSPLIMFVVLASNVTKLICMIVLLTFFREPILATIGDGIASFMARPDETADKPIYHDAYGNPNGVIPRWRKLNFKWWHAISRRRRLASLTP